ncbi:hypothetical protein RFI_02079 [Reticulomyxa filosa]|uniref:Chloride channel protein n=1 Tax=Reticulomyxa filosa TaxID=46433 RepID=X6P8Z6_RETFI|nr:hypothetical protein RFI_02079 [Reticulomyxa filosa]|eukprot:ETO34995.1 hypothetical protein RFI_02079 [Reticulomyxa filosa]
MYVCVIWKIAKAPIGGMLFALEEVSSFWQPGLTWRAFFAATVSNLVLQLLLGCARGTCGSFSKNSLIDFQTSGSSLGTFGYKDLGFFLLIGVVGGIVGTLFNTINVRILRFRKSFIKSKLPKFLEIIPVSLLTSFLILAVPLLFGCRDDSVVQQKCDEDPSNSSPCGNLLKFGRFTCKEGYYNPAASLLFGKSETIISALYHQSSRHWFPLSQVFTCLAVYYVLILLACGTAPPAGLFIPLIFTGAALGHGMGQMYDQMFGASLDISVYALLGSAATLGGVTRMTISLTAIMVEITNDIYYLMPVMIVVMISKWIGDRFNKALYDSHVELKEIPYLEPKLPSWVPTYISAHDIMNPNVVCLPAVCSLRVLLTVINDNTKQHGAFPVLQGPDVLPKELTKNRNKYTQRSGTFAGMVLRWHIMILLQNRHYGTPEKLLKFARKNILTQAQMSDRSRKYKMHVSVEELGLKEHELDMIFIDLSPYTFLSPITVSPHTPINIVYNIFRGLAMRHLICLDENDKIAGVITCHELIRSNMREAVKRVHTQFDKADDVNEIFEQRLKFLKLYDTELTSTGNKWLSPLSYFLSQSISRRKQSNEDEIFRPLISDD